MGTDSAIIGGHDILALERFMDDTRHISNVSFSKTALLALKPLSFSLVMAG